MIRITSKFNLTIKEVEEETDGFGLRFLKAKGYCQTRKLCANGKGGIKRVPNFDFFNTIRLYGKDNLLNDIKSRLAYGKLNIVCYDADISIPILAGKLIVILEVYYWDFVKGKLGTKRIMKKEKK